MTDATENEIVPEEIARRAYLRFCDRGCVHGNDVDDWLAAERELLSEQEKSQTEEATQADPPPPRNRKARR